MDLTEKELEVIAYTILGEAAGEGTKGMEAVAAVIMNRANDSRYPDNPAAVAIQGNAKGIHQFSAWNSPAMEGNSPISRYPRSGQTFQTALDIARRAVSGQITDPTRGATHFYATSMANEPYWWSSEAKHGSIQIGNHIFAPRSVVPTPASQAAAARVVAPTPATRSAQVAPTPASASQRPLANQTVRTVQTVQIDPRTGQVLSYAPTGPQNRGQPVKAEVPNPYSSWLGSTGMGRVNQALQSGVTRTAGGIAGTVQLPRNVTPQIGLPTPPSPNVNTRFLPEVPGPNSPPKTQDRLAPSPRGLDFVSTTPQGPQGRGGRNMAPGRVVQLGGAVAPQPAARVGLDTLRIGAVPVPVPTIARAAQPKETIGLQIGANGYVYERSAGGGVRRVAVAPLVVERGMSAAMQYDFANQTSYARRYETLPETAIGTNGYVYTKNNEGGYSQAGRVNTGQTAQQQYESINNAARQNMYSSGSFTESSGGQGDWFSEVRGW